MKKNISIAIISLLFLLGAGVLWNGYFQAISFEKAYDSAQYSHAQALLQDSKIDANNLHNLGNVSYRLWQEGKSEELSLLQDAQTYYSGALLQKEHPDTRYNYDLVTELLKNSQVSEDTESGEKKDKEKSKETSESQSGSSDSQSGSGQTSSGSSQQDPSSPEQGESADQKVLQNARGEEYKISQEEQIETLSPTEREALESAIEELKQQQTQNQSYFGKQPDSSSDFQKAFEDLMGGKEEKDW